jgi:hypothetical protein
MADYIFDENKFDYNIDRLCDMTEGDFKQLIELHGETMDSSIQNIDFYAFELGLNRLYESIRTLEELTGYTEQFIRQNIKSSMEECRALLKDINTNVDSVKQSMYQTTNVKLMQSLDTANDRNGAPMPKCELYDGELVMPGTNKKPVAISSCQKTKGFAAYESNIETLAAGIPYRTIYLMDGQVSGGIKEELRIKLQTPTEINFIGAGTSNCVVEAASLIDVDGNMMPLDNLGNVSCARQVSEIVLSLACGNYEKKIFYYNKESADRDFWEQIAASEYQGLEAEKLADYDEISGLNTSQDNYNEYLDAVSGYYSNLDSFRIAQENYDVYTDKIENYKYNPTVVLGGDSYVEHDTTYKAVQVPVMTILVANTVDHEPYSNAYAGIENVRVVTMTECSANYQEWINAGYNIIAVGAADNYKQFNEIVSATYKGMLAMDTAAQSQCLAILDASMNNEVYAGDPFYVVSYSEEASAVVQSMVDKKGVDAYVKVIGYEPATSRTSGVLYIQRDKTMYVASTNAEETAVRSWGWTDGLVQLEKLLGTFATMKDFIEGRV